MVPELRERHRRVWRMAALVLPVGFVLAILALPKQPIQTQLYQNTAAPLDKLEQTRETEWLRVQLFATNANSKQLEITVKKPLNIPAAQVYWQDTYLGSLGAKGIQRFPLDSTLLAGPPYILEIKDPINKNVFQNIIIHP